MMMKRVCTWLWLCLCSVSILSAQNSRLEFRNRTLADALTVLDELYPDTHIHFVYNELEAIRIDTTFVATNAEAAVRAVVSQLPIRVTAYRTHLFVEYLHASSAWQPDESDSYPLFIKLKPLPNVDFDYHLPTYQLQPSMTTLTVAGTPLTQVGTAFDLLAYLPGLMVDDPSVMIYIDGLPVSMLSELTAWDADAIGSIDYSVNDRKALHTTKSRVVNIHTLRHAGQGLQGQLQSRLANGHGLSYRQSASADMHREKYDLMTRLDYERLGVYRDININELPLIEKYSTHTLDLSVGMNIRLNDHHTIGFKYQYMDLLNTIRKTSEEVMLGSFDPNDVSGFENRKSTWILDYAPRHDLNLYYRGEAHDWQFRTGANFYQDGVKLSDDYNPSVTPNLQRNIISNTLWAVMAEAEHPLGKGRVSLGAEYSFTRREDRYLQQSNRNEIKKVREQNRYSARASYLYPIAAFTAEAGLRYEYIDALISLDQHLFPFASMSFNGGGLQVNASYAMHSIMPTYGQTNSFAHNSLEMLTVSGNPDLRPSVSHQASLQAQYGKFYLTGNLQQVTDYVAQRIGIYAAGYFLNYQNVRKATLSDLTLLYSDIIGPWQTQASATLLSQRLKCQYTDGLRTFNDPILQLVWHNQCRLPHAFTALFDVSYSTSGHQGTTWQRHHAQLDAGAVKTLGQWSIQLKATDLFRSATSQTLSYGNNVVYSRRCYADTRRLLLTVKYRFGKQKHSSKYEGVNAGADEMERMK